jgi:cytochrome P450/NADPH-cytochrome P450 reductase
MVAPLFSMPDCEKVAHSSLVELRTGGGEDGLFTMYNDDPQWGIAHRLLVPAFGTLSIRNMYDQMSDVLVTMLTRWAAYEKTVVDLPDQLTRLTLDTIALCSFDYRFNSFYKDEMHPFVNDMIEFLSAAATRVLNPVFSPLRVDLSIKWKGARKRMGDFGDQIIAERKKGSSQADDLCARVWRPSTI